MFSVTCFLGDSESGLVAVYDVLRAEDLDDIDDADAGERIS